MENKKKLPENTLDEKINFYQKEINSFINKWGNPNDYKNWNEKKQMEWVATNSDYEYELAKENLREIENIKKLLEITKSKTIKEMNKKLKNIKKEKIDELLEKYEPKS